MKTDFLSASPTDSARENSAEALGKGKIPRLVAGFALSALAGLALNSLYSLIDALFVSRGVGDAAMGGVSAVFPFVLLQSAVSTAIGGGAATLVSLRLGEGKRREAGEITVTAMATFYACALLVTAMGFAFTEPLLDLFGAVGDIRPHARTYFRIILAGNVLSTGFSSIIRAEGKVGYAALIWVIPVTVNIILDAVFIFALDWGVAGSAAATLACQFTSVIMSIVFFARFSSQTLKNARPRIAKVADILSVGVPSLVQMGSLSLLFTLANYQISKIDGALGVTAFGYVGKLATYAAVPFTALGFALAPIVGYNYGAGNERRVKQTVRLCAVVAAAYALPALLIAECIPEHLIGIFTDDSAVISYGATGLRFVAASLVLLPFPLLLGATLQAKGKRLSSTFFYAAHFLAFVPLAFTLPRAVGTVGMWTAYLAAAAIAALAAAGYVLISPRYPAAPPYARVPHFPKTLDNPPSNG